MKRKFPRLLTAVFAPLLAVLGLALATALPASSTAAVTVAPVTVAAATAKTVLAVAPQVVVPAYYDTSYCNGWWRYASNWGRGCFVDGVGVVQDLKGDGVCVEAKYRDYRGYWLRAYNSTDCAGGAGKVFTVPKDPRTGSSYTNVRMYNGNGYYRTLSP